MASYTRMPCKTRAAYKREAVASLLTTYVAQVIFDIVPLYCMSLSRVNHDSAVGAKVARYAATCHHLRRAASTIQQRVRRWRGFLARAFTADGRYCYSRTITEQQLTDHRLVAANLVSNGRLMRFFAEPTLSAESYLLDEENDDSSNSLFYLQHPNRLGRFLQGNLDCVSQLHAIRIAIMDGTHWGYELNTPSEGIFCLN